MNSANKYSETINSNKNKLNNEIILIFHPLLNAHYNTPPARLVFYIQTNNNIISSQTNNSKIKKKNQNQNKGSKP